jgi:hypothetical protein
MSENPETSVIVINMNGLQFLPICFSALGRQTYKDFETLLVDNGSTDGSVKFVRENFPNVIVLELGSNLGFGGGNNKGIQAARGKYIALLNNDTEVDQNWLAELLRGIKLDFSLAMSSSKLVFADNPGIVDSAGDEISWFGQTFSYRYYPADHPDVIKPRRCFSACAGAALYRHDVLDELGLFDDLFGPGYYEDVDLGFRAQMQGYECLYVPTAIVRHKVSGTMKRNRDRYIYLNQRNVEYLLLINFPTILLFRCLPVHLLYIAGSFLVHLIRGEGCPYLRAKIEVLHTLPAVLRKRSGVQKKRRLAINALRKKFIKGWFWKKLSRNFRKL